MMMKIMIQKMMSTGRRLAFNKMIVITREMYGRIDMQTHAGRLGLGFDLLTLGSVHAEVLPYFYRFLFC